MSTTKDSSYANILRCTSTGRQCEYVQPVSRINSHVISFPQVLDYHSDVSSLAHKSDNVRYLEFYHRCTSQGISSGFDKGFWSRISLQIGQTEPCVRHALIALGFLTMNMTGSLQDDYARFGPISKPKTLLFHYNKAVDALLKRMSEASYVPEIGLVSCILFICIEYLRGNHMTALIHFTSGLNILSAMRESQRPSIANTDKAMIDETLTPMFTRMMAMPLLYGIPTGLVFEVSPENIPSIFATIFEAQNEMHNVRNTAMLFIHDILETRGQGVHPNEQDWQRRNTVLQSHKAWLSAMDNFQQQKTLSKEDIHTIHSLKASYYSTYIFAACILHENQLAFDAHLSDFKAIIHHAKLYLDTLKTLPTNTAAPKFTFEISIIPHLSFTASYCRCPATRREAIRLLERKPPREGLCDAGTTLLVAKRIVEFEESEVDPVTGWPTEKARIWVTVTHGDMDEMGRFSATFSVGIWGKGATMPILAPGVTLTKGVRDRLWREWFVLEE